MRKTYLLIALLFCFAASAQLDNTFGIKAGANYSQFRPDVEFYGEKVLDFQGKIGYYVGGFFNIGISDKTSIRPELLFANQGTKTSSEFYVEYVDFSDPMVGEVVTKVNELMILLPIDFRIELVERFYLELGIQPGYAIKRVGVAKKIPFDSSLEGEKERYSDFDEFDFGLNGGLGFDLTDRLELNARYSLGLIELNDFYKTSVISLGLGFNI